MNTSVKNDQLKKIVERGFKVPQKLHKERLLFIGMNPSFTVQKLEYNDLVNYYMQPSDDSNRYKPYYNSLDSLAKKVEMDWTHWDLYLFRKQIKEPLQNSLNY